MRAMEITADVSIHRDKKDCQRKLFFQVVGKRKTLGAQLTGITAGWIACSRKGRMMTFIALPDDQRDPERNRKRPR